MNKASSSDSYAIEWLAMNIEPQILELFNAANIKKQSSLQTLWSGYGSIDRYTLKYDQSSPHPQSIIIKRISPPDNSKHPRGWHSSRSHQRKLHSYEVEMHWYQAWSANCGSHSRIAECYGCMSDGLSHYIILEDLDASGFNRRTNTLKPEQTYACLEWLAHFHANFIKDCQQESPSDTWPEGLWSTGSYWHLATRPDEWQAMADSELKWQAETIDKILTNCRFRSVIHGDAKVANFCFNADFSKVAAVDFQYVGGGCGMKDIAYFLGSCLSEQQCQRHYKTLLDVYFSFLQQAIKKQNLAIDSEALEEEWRALFSFAWADFHRFILGWAPEHPKNTRFSQQLTAEAIAALSRY